MCTLIVWIIIICSNVHVRINSFLVLGYIINSIPCPHSCCIPKRISNCIYCDKYFPYISCCIDHHLGSWNCCHLSIHFLATLLQTSNTQTFWTKDPFETLENQHLNTKFNCLIAKNRIHWERIPSVLYF